MFSDVFGCLKLVRLKFVSSFEFSTNVTRKGGPFRRKTFARLRKHGFLSAGPLCHMRHPSLGSTQQTFWRVANVCFCCSATNVLPRETFAYVGKQTAACIPTEHPLAALARKNAGESAVPPWVVQLWAILKKAFCSCFNSSQNESKKYSWQLVTKSTTHGHWAPRNCNQTKNMKSVAGGSSHPENSQWMSMGGKFTR